MFISLWGVVQVTVRIALPNLTALDSETPVTWEGACRACRELMEKLIKYTLCTGIHVYIFHNQLQTELAMLYHAVTQWTCSICAIYI